jgi:hypothetical protein
MGARAVVTITDRQGISRSFWAAWASPEYLIPHLADFLAWTDERRYRLTVAVWLAFADAYPGTLPREDVTGTAAADSLHVGDLDYRYQLDLHEGSGAMRLRVFRLRGPDGQPRPHLVAELTRATLFAEAARLCDLLADQSDQPTGHNGAITSPDTEGDAWRRQATRFRRLHASGAVTALDANLRAALTAGDFAAPYPSLVIAGVQVIAYASADGVVHVAVYPGEVDTWLRRADGTPVVRISVDGTAVFAS